MTLLRSLAGMTGGATLFWNVTVIANNGGISHGPCKHIFPILALSPPPGMQQHFFFISANMPFLEADEAGL